MTLRLLWLEYREKSPQGIGYSRFCGLYGEWRQSLNRHLSKPIILCQRFKDYKENGGLKR